MNRIVSLRSLAIIFSVMLAAGQLFSQQKQQANKEFEPEVGQEGKDVVWVPTPQALVDKMLELADAKPGDLLVDLGSGDGRTVITAAKRGIKAIGVEFNPDMVALSYKNAEKEGVKGKVEFVNGDLFEYDFSKATVVTMFLLPDINLRLRPQILEMKPGTRIVTNTFTMGDWIPDDTARAEDESTYWNTAYLWIVPAKVEGRWKLQPSGEIVFLQEFQMVKGEIITGGRKETISEGKIRGEEITFTAGNVVYKGKIRGNTIEGTADNGKNVTKWTATR
ncbi:MAG TPA: methyltransferase domain-containing protein [Bacteroidales bacterium]|nr:methyltransferase domain-containing protein [Bacteroidales bacterium]HRR93627.1 methyltransferase domain-containing protein [Bacteroidales bacterium]